MKSNELTILIPVKDSLFIDEFIKYNKNEFNKYKVMVIDSGGGESLLPYATYYFKENLNLTDARKFGYSFLQTPYVLNLDADVIIPNNYIEDALKILKSNDKNVAVSIFYENIMHCQGALEYGISIWKSDILKNLYDFSFNKTLDRNIYKVGDNIYSTLNNGWCECNYMWRKIKNHGFNLETLNIKAIHLKEKRI